MSDSDSGATEGPQEDVPRHIQDWPDREVERYIHYKSTLRQMKGANPQRRLYELKLRALIETCKTNTLEDIVRRINITAERIGPNERDPQQWPDVPCDAGLWDPIQLEKYMELRQQYQELRRPTRANQTERVRVGAILVRIEENQQQRLDEGVLIWRKFPANLTKPRDMMLRAGFPIRTIPHHSSDWTYEDARRYVAYRDALERQPPNGQKRMSQRRDILAHVLRLQSAKTHLDVRTRQDAQGPCDIHQNAGTQAEPHKEGECLTKEGSLARAGVHPQAKAPGEDNLLLFWPGITRMPQQEAPLQLTQWRLI